MCYKRRHSSQPGCKRGGAYSALFRLQKHTRCTIPKTAAFNLPQRANGETRSARRSAPREGTPSSRFQPPPPPAWFPHCARPRFRGWTNGRARRARCGAVIGACRFFGAPRQIFFRDSGKIRAPCLRRGVALLRFVGPRLVALRCDCAAALLGPAYYPVTGWRGDHVDAEPRLRVRAGQSRLLRGRVR